MPIMLVATARNAADLFAPLLNGGDGETVAVAHLDAAGRLLGITTREGEGSQVTLPIREIVADALRLGTAGLIAAHNHPSGAAEPSAADLDATHRLGQVAAALDMRLLDHLIFGSEDVVSLRGLGLL